jgi:hypothetical protein
MSTDPLSQLYKCKCHGQLNLNKRTIKLVCQYLKLGIYLENGQRVYFTNGNVQEVARNTPAITLTAFFALCQRDANKLAVTFLYIYIFKTRYNIYKNAVLFMMIELDRGCAHLISISGYTRNRTQNPTIKFTRTSQRQIDG